MSLRVTAVERFTLNVPFRERSRPWNEILVAEFAVVEVVRVRTNAPDLIGYGESLPHYTWARTTDAAVARVLGRHPAELMGDDTLGAGLQMALYDLVGKALGVPVYQLLGQPMVRQWCPLAWWSTKMPADVLAEEAKDALAEGYLAHKLKARPWFDVREQVAAISAVTPETYVLDLDWNGMLRTPGEAVEVLRELDRSPRVGVYESPVLQSDVAGQKALRARVDRPLAEHYNKALFPVWMREDAIDGFVSCNAGVAGTIAQGLQAAAFNKDLFLQIVGPGLTTAWTLHLGAVLTHARWPAVTCLNVYADDLVTTPIEIRGGYARVPEAPGLGVEFDEEALERWRVPDGFTPSPSRKLLGFHLGDGRLRTYAGIKQLFEECRYVGNLPVQPRGARLEVREDDGTAAFDTLYRQAERAPVWE
ncbi:mandelate racemase/muconate lactonizing enzyme family protein [Nonomuraea typhae]|uniref:mandelate racemase/muconate lactonizing enzyme family protein n=1 Tax=Nonomuraea typhae TaxID=2603600 RepID=UPI0012F9DEF7|nr:enolase C-terminal domain-like protein [Nonomuraea typhae]